MTTCFNCDCKQPKDCCCDQKPLYEVDIVSAGPECCCRPCWDTCKCMDEILKNKDSQDDFKEKTEQNITNLNGRITKVEKDVVDFNSNLQGQIGELAEQIDGIDLKIVAEENRAKGAENDLSDRITAEVNRATGAEQALGGRIDNADAAIQANLNKINTEIEDRKELAVASADYDREAKIINFRNSKHEIIAEIDATAFIVDGMVKNVLIIDGALEIQWNSDKPNEQGNYYTRIPISDIFNADNYYTKAQVDGLIAPINTKVTTQTVSYNNPLLYGDTVTIAKVNNIDIPVTLPAVPASVQSATQDGNGNNIADTYVTSLGTNGNYVTWTKASATNNITVPYSVKAQQDANGDVIHSTYLKSTDASNVYETQQHASNTYETQSHASNTYATKQEAVTSIALQNDHLLITYANGSSLICALPQSSIYVINLENRLAALEAMWDADPVTDTLSPKSPYTNVSMSGNLSVGGNAAVTGTATVAGSTTAAGFYDSTIS